MKDSEHKFDILVE